jgi:hypothetical protein
MQHFSGLRALGKSICGACYLIRCHEGEPVQTDLGERKEHGHEKESDQKEKHHSVETMQDFRDDGYSGHRDSANLCRGCPVYVFG